MVEKVPGVADYSKRDLEIAADNLHICLIESPGIVTDLTDMLVGALLIALPYVEDCLDSGDFKKGVVKRHVAILRAALAKAGVH